MLKLFNFDFFFILHLNNSKHHVFVVITHDVQQL